MSRRGTTRDSTDALELFLDALSNAFGGILFIALLVCVRLQLSKALPLVDPQEVERLESVRAELENDVENLLEAHKNLTRQINSMPKADPRLVRYRSLVEEREKLRQRGMSLQTEERRLETDVAKSERQRAAWNVRSSRLKRELRRARNELEAAKSKDALVVRRPRARKTQKQRVQALLSGGRLRFGHKYDGSGNRVGQNDRDIEISNGKVTPKPGRGLVIEASEGSRQAFKRQMAQFNASGHYLELFVWSDSFSSFELIRDWAGRMEFEHDVKLYKDGDVLTVGPAHKGTVQ